MTKNVTLPPVGGPTQGMSGCRVSAGWMPKPSPPGADRKVEGNERMHITSLEMSKDLSDAFFNPSALCYDSARVIESTKPSLSRRTRLAIEREVRGEEFFSFQDLAERWHCSRGTVRNRLRALGAQVLDFSAAGKRGKKVVAASVVFGIESKRTRRLC